MSAVEVITAALAAGAGVGVRDTASAAVKDAYAGLKALLRQRLSARDDHLVQALEADETLPDEWHALIGDALTDHGIADDEQVLDAARRLLAAADAEKANGLHIRVDLNNGAIGAFHAPVTFHQAPPVPPASPAVD
jgi:hypothetical protein